MKHKKMTKKLVFKKETISDLALKEVRGGIALERPTLNYSECGTGPATIAPCMCPETYFYSQCGTAPATAVPCLC
jgi:hypothetical protein